MGLVRLLVQFLTLLSSNTNYVLLLLLVEVVLLVLLDMGLVRLSVVVTHRKGEDILR